MDVIKQLKWRYATKKFDADKPLSEAKLAVVKEAFNLTATSYGLQPIKLIIINDKTLQEKLVEYSWNQQQIADASHVLVFCIESKINESYIKEYFKRVKTIRETPEEILNPFKDNLIQHFSSKSTEDVKDWATRQAYLAMGNLLTICATEGIDACPMEGFVPEKYDAILSLASKGLESVLVMPIGYRASDDIFSNFKKVRKAISEVIIEI
ncbi:NAD(P)H-dependent oxidoreductase [Leptobacterium sp. I13]|uniref:NAD(P)H-dependent oxidoreductase n=1 Tax=Leptobacterium meishanense TaxID=3128904 RepID=UPI0030ECF860